MPKQPPRRQCVGCREKKEKSALLRVVRDPAGAVAWDRGGKAAGRGAYLCPCADCLRRARKSRALERALASPLPPEVYDALEEALNADG